LNRVESGARGAYLFAGLVHCLRWVGLSDESLFADKIARAIDASIATSVGHTYWMMGNYRKAAMFTTGDIGYLQGVSLASLGEMEQAIQILYENEVKTARETIRCYQRSLRFALEGEKDQSLLEIKSALARPGIDGESLFYLMRTLAFIGSKEEALLILDLIILKGFTPSQVFDHDPWLTSLRDEPKYLSFLHKLNLSRAQAREAFYKLVPNGLKELTPHKVPT
jgi:hypothetical protein